MTDRFSSWRRGRARFSDETGAVFIFMALLLIVMLGAAGVALDVGHAYLSKARISRAVDAGALAAARNLRQGQEVAEAEAIAVARANGVAEGMESVTTSIGFGMNDRGENTVEFRASRSLPTVFARLLGVSEFTVGAMAEAAAPPLDIVLVLDTSGSLGDAGAWDDLQDAAEIFVQFFSDQLDQMGLVSFQVTATHLVDLRHDFTTPITQQLSLMDSEGDTNIGEALRRAHQQITGPEARGAAAKAVVFFTDGRATAVRDNFDGHDRVMAVYVNGNRVRGYFNNPDQLGPFQLAAASGCVSVANCLGYNEASVRTLAAQKGLDWADNLRDAGVIVYSIGLGNLAYGAGDIRLPNLGYLRQVANEAGVSDPDQPQGRMYFAPSPAELEQVFAEVAADLVVRLAK